MNDGFVENGKSGKYCGLFTLDDSTSFCQCSAAQLKCTHNGVKALSTVCARWLTFAFDNKLGCLVQRSSLAGPLCWWTVGRWRTEPATGFILQSTKPFTAARRHNKTQQRDSRRVHKDSLSYAITRWQYMGRNKQRKSNGNRWRRLGCLLQFRDECNSLLVQLKVIPPTRRRPRVRLAKVGDWMPAGQ